MEMNVDKTTVLRISEIMVDQKPTEVCGIFQLFVLHYNTLRKM
jgi:hypothetical protein